MSFHYCSLAVTTSDLCGKRWCLEKVWRTVDWWSQGIKGCSSQLSAQERKFCVYLEESARHGFPTGCRAISPREGISQSHLVFIPSKSIRFSGPSSNQRSSVQSHWIPAQQQDEEKQEEETSSGFNQSLPPPTQTKSSLPQIRAHNPGQLSKNDFRLTLGFKILLWIPLEKQYIKVNHCEDIFYLIGSSCSQTNFSFPKLWSGSLQGERGFVLRSRPSRRSRVKVLPLVPPAFTLLAFRGKAGSSLYNFYKPQFVVFLWLLSPTMFPMITKVYSLMDLGGLHDNHEGCHRIVVTLRKSRISWKLNFPLFVSLNNALTSCCVFAV